MSDELPRPTGRFDGGIRGDRWDVGEWIVVAADDGEDGPDGCVYIHTPGQPEGDGGTDFEATPFGEGRALAAAILAAIEKPEQ